MEQIKQLSRIRKQKRAIKLASMQEKEKHANVKARIRRTRVATALLGAPERGSTDKHTVLPVSLGERKAQMMQCGKEGDKEKEIPEPKEGGEKSKSQQGMLEREKHAGKEPPISRTRVTIALLGVPEWGSTDKHTAPPDTLGERKELGVQSAEREEKRAQEDPETKRDWEQ